MVKLHAQYITNLIRQNICNDVDATRRMYFCAIIKPVGVERILFHFKYYRLTICCNTNCGKTQVKIICKHSHTPNRL